MAFASAATSVARLRDFVLIETETGRVHTAKRLTTPDDPARAMLAGLTELGHSAPGSTSACERLAHATTLIANAVIERKGAKTALLCTAGFRDVIELRRYVRVTTYEMFADPPTPLVPRHLRLPVNERTRADGSVLRPVDPVEIEQIAAQLRSEGVKTVAICFLHAFSNPANERAAGRAIDPIVAGRRDLSLICRASPDQGVRAQLDHGHQCLREAAHGGLPGAARKGHRRRPAFDRHCRSCSRMEVSAPPGPRRSFQFGLLNRAPSPVP